GGLCVPRGRGAAQGADRDHTAGGSVRHAPALCGQVAATVATTMLGEARSPSRPVVGPSASVGVDGAMVLVGRPRDGRGADAGLLLAPQRRARPGRIKPAGPSVVVLRPAVRRRLFALERPGAGGRLVLLPERKLADRPRGALRPGLVPDDGGGAVLR